MDAQVPTNPKIIAERGEKIYNEKFREKYEKKHLGRFVAIDVASETAYLGDSPEAVLEEARRDAPKGTFHLIKVGSPGTYRVTYSSSAELDWIFH